MTRTTRIMFRFVMMAAAVIMILGAARRAHAGPWDDLKAWAGEKKDAVVDRVKDEAEQKKDELIEKTEDYADEKSGGTYSKGMAAGVFVFEGHFLKFHEYSNEGKIFAGHMFFLLFILCFCSDKEKKGFDPKQALGLLAVWLAFSAAFEYTRTLEDWTENRVAIANWFWLVWPLGLAVRYRSIRDFVKAMKNGRVLRFLTSFAHGLMSAEELMALRGGTAALPAPPGTVTGSAPTPASPPASSGPAQPGSGPAASAEAPPPATGGASPASAASPPTCPGCTSAPLPAPGKFCLVCGYRNAAPAAPAAAPAPAARPQEPTAGGEPAPCESEDDGVAPYLFN